MERFQTSTITIGGSPVEATAIFVPNLEVLPNTGRSNKVATVLMCQDLAQLTDGYQGAEIRQ